MCIDYFKCKTCWSMTHKREYFLNATKNTDMWHIFSMMTSYSREHRLREPHIFVAVNRIL